MVCICLSIGMEIPEDNCGSPFLSFVSYFDSILVIFVAFSSDACLEELEHEFSKAGHNH